MYFGVILAFRMEIQARLSVLLTIMVVIVRIMQGK